MIGVPLLSKWYAKDKELDLRTEPLHRIHGRVSPSSQDWDLNLSV